jgi:hypothetical protein
MSNEEFMGYDADGDEAGYDDGTGIDEQIVGDDGAGDAEAGYEADVLGALVRRPFGRRRRPMRRQAQGLRSAGGRRIFRQPPLPKQSFQPNMARLRSYLGMGAATWGPTATNNVDLTVEPQESFRGERLVIDVGAAGGTSAGLVTVVGIYVGTLPQSPSVEQPAPAAMFARDVTNSRLDLQIAFRATKLKITLGITAAPGAGVTVTAVAGFYGEWIR